MTEDSTFSSGRARRRGLRSCATTAVLAAAIVAVGASPAPVHAAPASCAGTTHEVVAGDTWFGIAKAAGISTSAILDANDASDDTIIRPGEIVCVPSGSSSSSSPSPSDSSTSSTSTSSSSGTSAGATCASRNLVTYTVVTDDSWFGIAQRNGTSMRALLQANDATDTTMIVPGDVLCLPAARPGGTGSTSTGTSSGSSSSSSSSTTTSSRRTCATSSAATRTVVRDDSWFSIAQRADVTLAALLDANDAKASTNLYEGDVVCLPPPGSGQPVAPGTTRIAGMTALPVQGDCYYIDTWRAPRGAGRRHEGVDLLGKRNSYIYAVTDGVLTSRAWDQPGLRAGNAWWLKATDGSGTYYFYAHLSGFAPALKVGSHVKAGQIIGYLGETGNAAGPHLHFEIHPGGGAAINPYPAVKALGGCNTGAPYRQPG